MFLPGKSPKVLTLMYCIREVPSSNFRLDTDYLETLVVFVNLSWHAEICPCGYYIDRFFLIPSNSSYMSHCVL